MKLPEHEVEMLFRRRRLLKLQENLNKHNIVTNCVKQKECITNKTV